MDRRGPEARSENGHLLSRRSPLSIGIPQNFLIVDRAAFAARPAVTVDDITDPTAAGSGIDEFALDAVQLPSQPLRARRVTVRAEGATIVRHAVDARLRTRTRVGDDQVTFVSFGAGCRGTVGGIEVASTLLLAAGPGAEALFVVEPGWESIAYLLPVDTMRAHLESRERGEAGHVPTGVDLLQTEPSSVRRLHAWGRRLVDAALAEPGRFDSSAQVRRAVQAELVELLLAAWHTGADREPSRKELTRQERSRIVRIAEDHALAHAGERTYVSDLCRATKVSERSLEVAFKQTLGLAPVSYLTRLRLHRVRDELQSSLDPSLTVSSAALDWGFWHFGEFSRAYKACFGEAPSQTLHRRPGLPRRAETQTRGDNLSASGGR